PQTSLTSFPTRRSSDLRRGDRREPSAYGATTVSLRVLSRRRRGQSISAQSRARGNRWRDSQRALGDWIARNRCFLLLLSHVAFPDRKSTRLNSSHQIIS